MLLYGTGMLKSGILASDFGICINRPKYVKKDIADGGYCKMIPDSNSDSTIYRTKLIQPSHYSMWEKFSAKNATFWH